MSESCPFEHETVRKLKENCLIKLGFEDTKQYTVIGIQEFEDHKEVLVKWDYSGDLARIITPCSHMMFNGKDIAPTLIAINNKITMTHPYKSVEKIMINSNYDVPIMVDGMRIKYSEETIGTAVCYGIILDYGYDVVWKYAP